MRHHLVEPGEVVADPGRDHESRGHTATTSWRSRSASRDGGRGGSAERRGAARRGPPRPGRARTRRRRRPARRGGAVGLGRPAVRGEHRHRSGELHEGLGHDHRVVEPQVGVHRGDHAGDQASGLSRELRGRSRRRPPTRGELPADTSPADARRSCAYRTATRRRGQGSCREGGRRSGRSPRCGTGRGR